MTGNWFARCFGAAVFLIPPVGLFIPRGIAVIFVGLAVVSVATLISERVKSAAWPKSGTFFLFLLAAWSMLSAFWSIAPEKSFLSSLSVAPTFAAGLCILVSAGKITAEQRVPVEKCMMVGVVVGALIVFIEVSFGLPISAGIDLIVTGRTRIFDSSHSISRGMTVLALFIWPTAFVLWIRGRKLMTIALMCFVAVGLFSGDNEAAVFSMATGVCALALACIFPKRSPWVFGVILGVGILMAPQAMLSLPDARTMSKTIPGLGYGVYPRIFIWQSASRLILEKPVIGHGYRSSREFSTEHDSEFVRIGPEDVNRVWVEPIPLHTHNAPLQLWLELGVIGASLGIAIILNIIAYIQRSCAGTVRCAALYAALITGVSVASISYGFWQGWWQSVLWIYAALCFATVAFPGSKITENDQTKALKS